MLIDTSNPSYFCNSQLYPLLYDEEKNLHLYRHSARDQFSVDTWNTENCRQPQHRLRGTPLRSYSPCKIPWHFTQDQERTRFLFVITMFSAALSPSNKLQSECVMGDFRIAPFTKLAYCWLCAVRPYEDPHHYLPSC